MGDLARGDVGVSVGPGRVVDASRTGWLPQPPQTRPSRDGPRTVGAVKLPPLSVAVGSRPARAEVPLWPAPPSVRQELALESRRGREHAERCAVGVTQDRCSACPWDVHRWHQDITSVLLGLSRSLIDILGLEIAHPMALGAA
jgi:hypothetical protein